MKTIKVTYKILFAGMYFTCSCAAFAEAEIAGGTSTFFRQFFVSGGPIVWFVLLPMSVITVYLAIDLLVTVRRSRLLPAGLVGEIAAHAARHGTQSLFARLSGETDLVSGAVLRALDQGRQLGGTAATIRQCAAEALQERGLGLMRKAQWCQIVGSVAPMVGLFGTVFGMIRAFNLLGQGSEGPRYELLADAISIALVTTFWGLLVGIPALFFYGMFQTRIEAFVSEAAMETDVLLGRLFEQNAAAKKTAQRRQPVESFSANGMGG